MSEQVTHKYGYGDHVTVNPETFHGGPENVHKHAPERPGLLEEYDLLKKASGTVVRQGVFLGVLPVYHVLLDEPVTLSDGTEVGGFEQPFAVAEHELTDGNS